MNIQVNSDYFSHLILRLTRKLWPKINTIWDTRTTRKHKETYKEVQLQVHTEKTEYLIVGNHIVTNLRLENIKIKSVEICKYLGVRFSNNGSSEEEIVNRMYKGRKLTKC